MRRAFMVDVEEDGYPTVYVAVTHDNRFIGVFGSRPEADRVAGGMRGAFVSVESLGLALAGEDRNR